MASWATLQFESPFTRGIHFSLIFWTGTPLLQESLQAVFYCWLFQKFHILWISLKLTFYWKSHFVFLVPLLFFSIPPFCWWRCSKSKSKDPSMFFSSSDPSNALKKMEIKRHEQQKWRRSNGSKQSWREMDPSARTSNATACQGFRLRQLNKPLLICKLLFCFVFVRCSCFRIWLGLLLFTTNFQKVFHRISFWLSRCHCSLGVCEAIWTWMYVQIFGMDKGVWSRKVDRSRWMMNVKHLDQCEKSYDFSFIHQHPLLFFAWSKICSDGIVASKEIQFAHECRVLVWFT